MRGSNSNENLEGNASLQSELKSLLLQQQHNRGLVLERERDLDINRSGSAPPTVEGALSAVGSLFKHPSFAQVYGSSSSGNNIANLGALTEEEIRSHPAYLEYYYSHEYLNPRLPPPMFSRENWRLAQKVRAAGLGSSINLLDSGGNSSLFSMQPGLAMKKAEDEIIELRKAALRNISRKNSSESLDKCSTGSIGASSSGMGARRKSFADILQEGLPQPVQSQLLRAASQNSVADVLDSMVISNSNATDLRNKAETIQALLAEKTLSGLLSNQNISSVMDSSFKSTSPSHVTLGNKAHLGDTINSDACNFSSSSIFEIADIAASLSGVNMSRGQLSTDNILKPSLQVPPGFKPNPQQQDGDNSRGENVAKNVNYVNLTRNSGSTGGINVSKPVMTERASFSRSSSTSNLQSQRHLFDYARLEDLKPDMMINSDIGPVPLGTLLAAANADGQLLRSSNQTGHHMPVLDLHQLQYLQKMSDLNYIAGNSSRGIRSIGGVRSYEDLQVLERAYLEALLLQQVQQYQSLLLQKPGPASGPSADSCQGNVVLKSQIPRVGSRNSMLQNEKSAQMPSSAKNKKEEPSSSLHPQSGNATKGRFDSLLEVLKNNKTKSLELSDILGHVVEFSMDQFGSRFIQQKLETASDEEKTKVLTEIMPHARALMIDVFGNYVIQKFFEHGTYSQRKELATQMIGHVLALTLQMYGCRVIQKALEVVDTEVQTKMMVELDGSVMKCIHDQNGNHVIQKCIECVPQDRIQFMISSFLGQVVILSTHPYGCRVIQRVLEHCNDPKTQESIMEDIMGSVCKLAQDQYGNYVIQHVVQHGKPHQRSAVISKLAGQIVKMSQQKFASNVVEKCLTYGGPEERKLLVHEMLGSNDENEPLQAMMKDPFGNYVVQKVLETCDSKSRELILSRIKVHLDTLRKYTYGKHIVSRVEKLVAMGEKHTRQSSPGSS